MCDVLLFASFSIVGVVLITYECLEMNGHYFEYLINLIFLQNTSILITL